MSSAATWSIGEPQILASLPRPFDHEQGRTHASPVYAFDSSSRKRKRSEIVTGIDGISLNVYGVCPIKQRIKQLLILPQVSNPRLITSHPISPTSFLSCAPCCAHIRSDRKSPSRRYTYAAFQSESKSRVHKLVGFVEDVAPINGHPTTALPTKYEAQLTTTNGSIAHIDFLPSSTSDKIANRPQVLTVASDGRVEARTTNLQTVVASLTLGESRQALHVEQVILQDVVAARKGILQDRPDLLNLFGPTSTSAEAVKECEADSQLIVLVAKTGLSLIEAPQQRAVFLVSYQGPRVGTAESPCLKLLETWTLPQVASDGSHGGQSPSFAFDAPSGLLYSISGSALVVFELSLQAKVTQQYRLPLGGLVQLMSVSRSAVLLSCDGVCYLYDTKFGSIQASQQAIPPTISKPSRKRKRSTVAQTSSEMNLYSYHAKPGTVVGQVGLDLVALRIALPSKRNRGEGTRLIDAYAKNYGSCHNANDSKIEALLSCKQKKAFDESVFDMLAGIAENDPHRPYQEYAIALVALARAFQWKHTSDQGSSTSVSIKLNFMSEKVFAWLAVHDYLTPSNITKALYQYKTSNHQERGQVSATDMIAALGEFDSSLKLLALLCINSQTSVEATVACLRSFLTSFAGLTHPPYEQLLLNGTAPSRASPDAANTNEQPSSDTEEATIITLANTDLDLAFRLLNPTHAQLRAQGLRAALIRLGLCFAPSVLVSALRAQLSHNDTLLLINLLRLELSHAGWTIRRLDFYPSEDSGVDPADEAIAPISKLLNCCVDAIGIGGWLGSSLSAEKAGGMDLDLDVDVAAEDILESNASTMVQLRRATYASLEAAQESAFFANFLTDFLRYEKHVAASVLKDQAARGAAGGAQKCTSQEDGMLPLGNRTVQLISSVRVDAGGELRERSRRDVARKESQKVGRYEFEQIRI